VARLNRLLCVVGLGLMWVLLAANGVLAGGNPGRVPNLPLPPPFTQPMCGPGLGDITVSIDPNTYRSYVKTFTFKDGTTKIQFNGYARQVVQGNGKTLQFNVSGPGAFFIAPDGSFTAVGQGHLFYIGPVDTPQQGLFLYTGTNTLAVIDTATYGPIFVVSSYTGHKTDVCALLRG
jgi:hypothetical protein